MGWCSATEIFDDIAAALLEKGKKKPEPKDVLLRLARKLEDMDWDCQYDSAYIKHPVVREIGKELGWFDYEDEDDGEDEE